MLFEKPTQDQLAQIAYEVIENRVPTKNVGHFIVERELGRKIECVCDDEVIEAFGSIEAYREALERANKEESERWALEQVRNRVVFLCNMLFELKQMGACESIIKQVDEKIDLLNDAEWHSDELLVALLNQIKLNEDK